MYVCVFVSHDCVPKQQHSPPKAVTAFIVFHLLALRHKSFITVYMKIIILTGFYFLSVSLSGSDDFVLFDTLDGT